MSRESQLKKRPTVMQFSSKSFNSQFKAQSVAQLEIDAEIFNELENYEQFERKLGSFTCRPAVSKRRSLARSNSSDEHNLEYYAKLVRSLASKDSLEMQHFASMFQINLKTLQQIADPRQKEDFIIKSMTNHIKDQLSQFIARQDEKHLAQLNDDWIHYIKHKLNERSLNIFEWLQLSTNYKQLQKKLKYALLETINDTQNQNKALEFFSCTSPRPSSVNTTRPTSIPTSRVTSRKGSVLKM